MQVQPGQQDPDSEVVHLLVQPRARLLAAFDVAVPPPPGDGMASPHGWGIVEHASRRVLGCLMVLDLLAEVVQQLTRPLVVLGYVVVGARHLVEAGLRTAAPVVFLRLESSFGSPLPARCSEGQRVPEPARTRRAPAHRELGQGPQLLSHGGTLGVETCSLVCERSRGDSRLLPAMPGLGEGASGLSELIHRGRYVLTDSYRASLGGHSLAEAFDGVGPVTWIDWLALHRCRSGCMAS